MIISITQDMFLLRIFSFLKRCKLVPIIYLFTKYKLTLDKAPFNWDGNTNTTYKPEKSSKSMVLEIWTVIRFLCFRL